jgi:hypothetical protein
MTDELLMKVIFIYGVMIGGTKLHVITVCGLMTGEMIASVISCAK